MDLRDAAAFHLLVLKAEDQPAAVQRHHLAAAAAFLQWLEWKEILPECSALTADNIRAASAWWNGEPLVNELELWARFLKKEGL